jgi:3-ketosteroid 9alpha-monooxygenase subunit A
VTRSVNEERLHGGWYLVALIEELTGEITPLAIGDRALMAIRGDDNHVRVFDARCPHRGADLGYGGKVAGGCVICPFHGKRISLGAGTARLSVGEHRTLQVGEALFVRLGDASHDDRGFERAIRDIAERQTLVGAIVQPVAVPTDIVVENAFDVDHFASVHLVPRVTGMNVSSGPDGELAIEGEFLTKPPQWERSGEATFRSRFYARAFSPSLVITEIGSAGAAHTVITGGTPSPRGSVARVAVAAADGPGPALDALVSGSRVAIEQDVAVWDRLDLSFVPRFDSRDRQVLLFRQFCAGFAELVQ